MKTLTRDCIESYFDFEEDLTTVVGNLISIQERNPQYSRIFIDKDYGSDDSIYFNIIGERPETDVEEQKREEAIVGSLYLRECKERAQYEKLKVKYG